MPSRRTALRQAAVAGALALAVLSSCGGSSSRAAITTGADATSTPAPDVTSSASSSVAPTVAPTDAVTTPAETTTVVRAMKPCDLVPTAHVGAAFGGTATLVGNTVVANAQECTWSIAGPTLTGQVEITVAFPDPATLNGGAADAVALVHYQHDFTVQNFPAKVADLQEVPGVGAYAFLDTYTRTLEVAVSPRLALVVQYVSGSSADFGTGVSPAMLTALTTMSATAAADIGA